MNDVELIIVGAGCSGLALGARLAEAGVGSPRTILLDGRKTYTDDRTWCFWAGADHPWRRRATASWPTWTIGRRGHAPQRQRSSQRRYVCLRAIDYYRAQLERIEAHPDISLRRETRVHSIAGRPGRFRVETDRGALTATHVIDTRPDRSANPLMWQQFVGAEVRTGSACFDRKTAGLMIDMDCDDAGFVFTYLLPFAPDHALIESTRFSPALLPSRRLQADTRQAIERQTGGVGADLIRRETGCLPMGLWPRQNRKREPALRAGAGGGALRSASGYGFLRMQSWADACTRALLGRGEPIAHPAEPAWRHAMDRRFLSVLANDPSLGPVVFDRMSRKLEADQMIRFLGDDARLGDLLAMIAALPKRPFLIKPRPTRRPHALLRT